MKQLRHFVIFIFTLLCFCSVNAADKPLSPDAAFSFSAKMKDSQTIVVHWKVAPNYYLYRDRIRFTLQDPTQGALSDPILPTGKTKEDKELGKYQIYSDEVTVAIPYMATTGKNTVDLLTSYQGCSASGYCYPPTTKRVSLDVQDTTGQEVVGTLAPMPASVHPENQSEHDKISDILQDQPFFMVILSFLGFGLLLSFTPCVLPMIPILSSIIVGHRHPMHMRKAFALSSIYVISMSLTYAIAGLLVGYIGGSIQALFQQTIVLVFSSILFVALALSLFGFYEIQLPQALQNKLTMISNRQRGGNYLGVAIMGVLATLIVSPCVTPALVGALGYIGRTGDALLGFFALFSLGIGMGIPLLIIGTAGGKLLPKAGPWMDAIKNVFGVVLLGMAIWILERILPGQLTLFLWAALLIISSMYLGVFNGLSTGNWAKLRKGCGVLLLVYGTMMVVGASMGNDNPLEPLSHTHHSFSQQPTDPLDFISIKGIHDFENTILQTKDNNKIVILDFYADWCVSCKDMQRNTLTDPMVKNLLDHFTLFKADISKNDATDHALTKHFDVVAPPVLAFFKPDGTELTQYRLVGEIGKHELAAHLQKVLSDTSTE